MIIVENFLSPNVLKVVEEIKKNFNSKGPDKRLGWTNAIWEPYLQQNSALTFVVPVPELDESLQLLFGEIDPKFKDVKIDTQFCVWGKGTTIPFHHDNHVAFAATIYLNEEWRIEDGGLFIWKTYDKDQLRVVSPEYNLCVINDIHEAHHVSVINYGAEQLRLTLQIWAHCDPEEAELDNNLFLYG
jgi:Rps23 Pro-64 3,4-dihydroxylase Tpa1-like proline 4-hydroxylase